MYTTKAPVRGDVVIDHNLLPPNRGEIVSGIWNMSDDSETFTDCFVKYSNTLSEWYSVAELHNHWVEELNAYVLNASD